MLLSEMLFVVGIVFVLATLPLIVELFILTLASLLPEARVRDGRADSELPSLSVLIPAHNEEALIGRCVRALVDSAGLGTEVLVIAHNCSDATAIEASNAGARVLVLNDPAQRGKGSALSCGFASFLSGTSQAVLVIDADSVVDESLVADVRQGLRSGARALQCRYEVYNCRDSGRTRLMALALYAANVIRPKGRARLGLSAGILGNGFALHRDVLTQIPYSAHSIVEDLEYHLSLVQAEIRVEFIHKVAVRGEMPVTAKGAQAQRARWEGGRLRMMKRWAPRLASSIVKGRVRQIEPLLDLLALPIASEIILLLLAATVPAGWVRIYAAAAFSVLFFHVAVAAINGPGMRETLKTLSTIPTYIMWKLWIFPQIWRTSRAGAAWVRTERESSAHRQ